MLARLTVMSSPLAAAVLLALASTLPAMADSVPGISIGNAQLSPQSSGIIDINFGTLDQPISSLQVDLRFSPQVFTLSASAGDASVAAGKELSTSNPDAASLRILIVGLNQTELSGGVVAKLPVQVNPGAPSGVYPLVVENGVASTAAGMAVYLPSTNGSVTVSGPGPTVLAVANAASWTAGAVAPGEIVLIGGMGMGTVALTTTQLTAAGQVSTLLAGTRAMFDGIPAPLVYASQDLVSAIVPYEVNGHNQTSLQVEHQGVQSAPFVIPVVVRRPNVHNEFVRQRSGGDCK